MVRKQYVLLVCLVAAAACARHEKVVYSGQPAAAGERLNDASMVELVNDANNTVINSSRLALDRSHNSAVRSVAQRLINDHTRMNQLLAESGVSARGNNITNSMAQSGRKTVSNLSTYSGAAFDRQFIDSQIQQHNWMISNLNNSLIPGARSKRLRDKFREIREMEHTHLRMLQDVQSDMRNR